MRFKYYAPTTLEEISKLKEEGGLLFAGGTDVFVKMKAEVLNPEVLIDTKKIETPGVKCTENELEIFMNTTYTDVIKNDCAKKFEPLVKILLEVGSPQIRNRGTPVGNVGNASPAGDFLLATHLLDGTVVLAPSMREVKVEELVSGPGKLNMGKGEFIYSVKLKKLEGYKTFYEKVGRRNALVISIASIAAAVKLNGEIIEDVKIAYGSLGPTIVRFKDLEEEMKGKKLTEDLIEEFSLKYQARINPITDVRASAEYRKKLAKNLLVKAFISSMQKF